MTVKRSSGTSLGRGLAGILHDAYSVERAPEVAGLLGLVNSEDIPAVRQLVTELALGAIVEGFDAEGVILARTDEAKTSPIVSTRLPACWQRLDGPGFELAGHLFDALHREPDLADHDEDWPRPVDLAFGDRHVWIDRQDVGALRLVAGLIREQPVSQRERGPLRSLLRSVIGAIVGARFATPAGRDLVVESIESVPGGGSMATVGYGPEGSLRLVQGTGLDDAWAIAEATTGLLNQPFTIEFAAQTSVSDERLVTVVVMSSVEDGSPVVGLSVDPRTSALGPAIAVLSAAQSVGVMLDELNGLVRSDR